MTANKGLPPDGMLTNIAGKKRGNRRVGWEVREVNRGEEGDGATNDRA